MVAMLSRMCSLLRENGSQPWGFWLQGGRDHSQPITINKIGKNTIADIRGLRKGDTVLQIGRERTIDMNYADAENAVNRAGNRLDLLVLRPASQENAIIIPNKEDRTIRAIVHRQSNSPIGLYSPENVADTFIKQTEVLTKGTVRLQRNPQSLVQQDLRRMQKSDVYRMVHEEDSSEEEYTSSGSESPTPTYRTQQQAPAPPPKPAQPQQTQQQREQQLREQQQREQQMRLQQQREQQQREQQQREQQQREQQQREQQQRQQQQREQQMRLQQQREQQQREQQLRQQQQREQQQREQQRQQQLREQQQREQQREPQQRQHQYQQQQQIQYQQQQFYRREEDFNDRPKYQPYPQVVSQSKPAAGKSSTFQSNVPFVQNSTPSPQPHDEAPVNQIQWSPTTGRRRPVWPPPKPEPVLSTSSQSMKFAGGRPSKQFIWPPPKDFIEVTEEVHGNQRSVIYRHVPEDQANKSRVYVSPRAPAKLAAAAWEPYTPSDDTPAWMRGNCPTKRLRRFDDIFSSNATPLPPTYRAPPGACHVSS